MRWSAIWLAGLVLAAQERPSGVLAGTVVDEVTGAPVRNASVRLTLEAPGKPAEYFLRRSGADGLFGFEALAPGAYTLNVRKAGFADAGGRYQLDAAGRKSGLRIALTPLGVISGRVLDEDGEPVQGARIAALRRSKPGSRPRSGGSATTNDLGEYRISGLAAGSFTVSATYHDPDARMSERTQTRPRTYGTTFYPNGTEAGAAHAVVVSKGAETAGIDLRLRREDEYRVRVRVEGASAELLERARVDLLARDGRGPEAQTISGIKRLAAGVVELTGVRAGSWIVRAVVSPPGGEALMGVTPVEVSTADLADVVVRVGVSPQISGVFVFEGTGGAKVDWKKTNPVLVPGEGLPGALMARELRARVAGDGTFTLPYAVPGRYGLQVMGWPAGTYLASVRVGAEEYYGRDLELGAGPPGALKIVFRDNGAAVKGTVEGSSEGTPGIAVLAPVEAHLRRLEYLRTAAIEPGGTFAFTNVRPGEYLLCHVADYRTLDEEGEPPKEALAAAVRLKAEPGGAHDVRVKAQRAAAQP